MGDVEGGGGYTCVAMYGKSLPFPLNVAVNLKLI